MAVSAVWGQVDSICTALMLAALTLTFAQKYTLGWSALALAVLVKPFPLVLVPLFLVVQFADQRWSWKLAIGPVSAAIIAYVVSLPFAPTVSVAGVLSWLAGPYVSGQSLTNATSVNAYNIRTVAWPVTADSRVVPGLSLHAWVWLTFVGIIAPTTWNTLRRLTRQPDRVLREQVVTRACFIMLTTLFRFETRMHERYILFALVLVPLMWFCGRWERWAACTLLSTFTLGVTLVLGFYKHERCWRSPPSRTCCRYKSRRTGGRLAFVFRRTGKRTTRLLRC